MAHEKWMSKICIIGGGIAGIACANKLNQAGFCRINIYEAQDKLGGRIFTYFDKDTVDDPYKIEMGANWVHGTQNNPVFKIVTENQFQNRIPSKTIPKARYTWKTLQENGDEVPKDLDAYVKGTYRDLCEEADTFYETALPDCYNKKSNYQEFIIKECKRIFCNAQTKEKFGDSDELFNLMMDIISVHLSFETSISGCHSMSQVSLQQMGSYEYLKGGNPEIAQGYIKVIDAISNCIPPEKIHLKSPVVHITWKRNENSADSYIDRFVNRVPCCGMISSDRVSTNLRQSDIINHSSFNQESTNSCAKVDTSENRKDCVEFTPNTNENNDFSNNISSQGTDVDNEKDLESNILTDDSSKGEDNSGVMVSLSDGSEHCFDHVICSVSLGHLKHFQHALFEPSLPKAKQSAINKLGIGVVDKIFMEFENLDFLQSEHSGIMLCWRSNQKTLDIPKWVRKIVHISVVRKPVDNMLMAWITGLEAEEMERLSEEEVGEGCVKALRCFLKNKDIPNPKRVIRTTWGSNPYFQGSYSYISVGATTDDIDNLTSPLCDKKTGKPLVQFAGEATHPKYYSTVHGALLSGEREAQRLIDYYAKYDKNSLG